MTATVHPIRPITHIIDVGALADQVHAAITTERETNPGFLPYRWGTFQRSVKRGSNTPDEPFTTRDAAMLRVEDQLAIAYEQADGNWCEAHELLTAVGCTLTAAQTERLFDLSEQVADAEVNGSTSDFHVALDDYASFLHHLSLAVAGAR